MDVDVEDTPGLSPSGFTTESSLSPLSSSATSRSNTPPPPTSPEVRLTRRQRKALGLPKARPLHVVGKGSGKIVIPGGKFKKGNTASSKRASVKVEQGDEVEAEWAKNGTGRVDVRGFRELKI
jgi:OTU domain-containing protein 3